MGRRLPLQLPPPPPNLPVLDNNASAGKVVFTFDDGPGRHTLELISELKAEHVAAVFFEIGDKGGGSSHRPSRTQGRFPSRGPHMGPPILHRASTHTKPLTDAQVRSELVKCINAIVAAGAPGRRYGGHPMATSTS